MAKYPNAVQRPIDTKYLSGKSMAVYNRVNLHVQAGLGSLFGFFNQTGRASSHFWVAKDGTVEQYVDTALRAEADLDGNDATISIETEGGESDANGQPWTPQQIAALIALCRWIMDTHGIPKRLAENSHIGESSKGLSWHRLGIDGNFPALPSILAGRKQRGGGMYYSGASGKVCPGNAKIEQIPGILAGILNQTPEPTTTPIQEDVDMARMIRHPNGSIAITGPGAAMTILNDPNEVASLWATGQATGEIIQLPDPNIWDTCTRIAARHAAASSANPEIVAAAIAGLLIPAVVASLPSGSGVTESQIHEQVESAIRDVLGSLND